MIRTWIYVFCWAILGVIVPAWIDAPDVWLLWTAVFLLLLPWVLDAVLAHRALCQSGWTVAVRCLNVIPILLLIVNVLVDLALNRPAEVHHNQHHAMAAKLVGGEAPILETWYSQDVVFSGHGGEYLRIRFPREGRAAIEAALAGHCRVKPAPEFRWQLLSTSRPTAKSMPWDPPATPVTPRLCGPDPGFQTDFGTSGDSLLLYYEGH